MHVCFRAYLPDLQLLHGLMRSKHNELGRFATGCPPFDKDVYGPIWKDAQETASRPRHLLARQQHGPRLMPDRQG
jgi:hypothetical protein